MDTNKEYNVKNPAKLFLEMNKIGFQTLEPSGPTTTRKGVAN